MFLTYYKLLQSEKTKKIMVTTVIPSLLIDLLRKLPNLVSPVYVGTRPEAQTEHLILLYF